jgi:Heparinase II/III-like protein
LIKVLSLRSVQGSPKGLFLGIKGGTNGESHNHNDVGSFILYLNGQPALIDVGVGTYTRQTFGPDRYKLWYMQSQWHNLPTINGVMQHNGTKYKARDVSFKSSQNGGEFQLDIAGAYPKEAHVKKWVRNVHFDGPANTLTIKEQFELSQFTGNTSVHFITCLHSIEKLSEGKVKLSGNLTGSAVSMTVEFNSSQFELTHEQKAVKDKRIEHNWGEYVTRLNFTMKNNVKSGSHEFNFKMI